MIIQVISVIHASNTKRLFYFVQLFTFKFKRLEQFFHDRETIENEPLRKVLGFRNWFIRNRGFVPE